MSTPLLKFINIKMINTQTYCSHAFTSYDNRMESVCCRAKNTSPVLSYSHTFTHPEIQKMRADLLSGVRNPACEVCWKDEDLGLESTRQNSIKGKKLEQLEDEVKSPKLKWLWIDPGNYCNYACRTCFPTFSTTIGVEWFKKHDNKKVIEIKKPDLTILSQEDLSELTTVMIIGGEPFLNLEHLDILESIVKQGNSKNCTVIYVTNNSKKMPDKLKEYLNFFKTVIVTLSLDAVGKPFNYIRTKGIWEEFVDNFNFLKEVQTQSPNLNISFNITVGVLNCLYLDNVYSWIEKNHNQGTITSAFVEGAEQYTFKILKENQKQKVIELLENSRFDFNFVINSIKNSSYDPHAVDIFWKDAEWTKSYHGLDIEEHLPELTQLLKK